MNYGEDVINTSSRGFSILRPTIELPLDEILSNVDPNDDDFAASFNDSIPSDFDVLMQEPTIPALPVAESQPVPHDNNEPDPASLPPSHPVQESPPQTISPAKLGAPGGRQSPQPYGQDPECSHHTFLWPGCHCHQRQSGGSSREWQFRSWRGQGRMFELQRYAHTPLAPWSQRRTQL